MQAEVINAVMRRLETDLQKNENRMKESIEVINIDLGKRFAAQESNISSSIKNLEQYIIDVHSQQINEFDLLKKFTRALALGGIHQDDINTDEEIKAARESKQDKKPKMKDWIDEQMHTACTKDILLLMKELRRQESTTAKLSAMLTDLIKVNLKREVDNAKEKGKEDVPFILQSQQYLYSIENVGQMHKTSILASSTVIQDEEVN